MPLALASWLCAALAAEPGTFAVARRDVEFDDPTAGTVWARVHYPAVSADDGAAADPSGGPYPAAVFLHGWLGQAWMYDGAVDHLASLGLVVISLDTETGPTLDEDAFAEDARAALRWLDKAGRREGHWLEGAVADGDWTAFGHSMGGATLARLVAREPRVRDLVAFMPYSTDDARVYDAFEGFDGSALYLAGTLDDTSTPDLVEGWYDRMASTRRGLYALVPELGHQAISDLDWGTETLSDAVQRDLVLRFAVPFVRAEVLGEAGAWRDLLIDPATPPDRLGSRSTTPIVAIESDGPSRLAVAFAARGAGDVVVVAGTGPGATRVEDVGDVDVADAVVLGRLPLEDGVARGELDLPEGLSGVAWVQALAGDVRSDAVDVFGVGAPDDPGAGDDAPRAACGGCAQVDPSPLGLAAALLAFVRRRSARAGVLVAAAGCAGAPADPEDDPADDGEPVVDTDASTPDTDGRPCGTNGLVPGEDVELTLTWEGRERTYWLHVPADYDCTPRPVLVGLHFFSGEAHDFETEVLRIHRGLNDRGWFGLFPDALAEKPGGTWTAFNDGTSHNDTGPDGPTCTDWAYEQPTFDTCPESEADRACHWGTSCADDVGLVRHLLEELGEDFTVDPDRIFLTGFSQGAIAAQGWACPLGDVLAAVVPLHGFAANGYACGPSDGVSLMQVYGYWDVFVNGYDQPSADGLIYESAAETAAAWAEAQGCDLDGSTRYPTAADGTWGWGCTTHADCTTGAEVVSCEWDGTHIVGRDPVNGEFMVGAMWDFFETHPRRP